MLVVAAAMRVVLCKGFCTTALHIAIECLCECSSLLLRGTRPVHCDCDSFFASQRTKLCVTKIEDFKTLRDRMVKERDDEKTEGRSKEKEREEQRRAG